MNFRKTSYLLFILISSIFCACSNSGFGSSGSADNVLERVKAAQENSTSTKSYLIESVSEEELLKGSRNSVQLSVSDDSFKNSLFSSIGDVKKDSKGRNIAWVNESFIYFRFKLSAEYILSKNFVIYYDDIFNSKDYPNYSENPVLNNMYISFNRVIVTDINILENSIYCTIPKEALGASELEVIVLFPDGNGAFLEKGKNILSMLGIGFVDNVIETISPKGGIGYPLMSTKNGNLDEKATTGWYAKEDDGTWTKESMKFYFKTDSVEDMRLKTSYQTLRDDQECKVYFNGKYVGSLSKTEDVIFKASDFVSGVQKVEYKIEPPILESELVEGGSDKNYLGIKIRSITIK